MLTIFLTGFRKVLEVRILPIFHKNKKLPSFSPQFVLNSFFVGFIKKMTLFRMRWLRNFIRRSSKPINLTTAELWKRRLAIGYALIAWNAFGFVIYAVYQGKNDWALSKFLDFFG